MKTLTLIFFTVFLRCSVKCYEAFTCKRGLKGNDAKAAPGVEPGGTGEAKRKQQSSLMTKPLVVPSNKICCRSCVQIKNLRWKSWTLNFPASSGFSSPAGQRWLSFPAAQSRNHSHDSCSAAVCGCFISWGICLDCLLFYYLIPKSSCGGVGEDAERRDQVQILHKDSFVSVGREPGESQSDGYVSFMLPVLASVCIYSCFAHS